MRIIAFIGPSGTGKSHRAMFVARLTKAECIIDDGLLISGQKIAAGTSGKREQTKIACVKHALFLDNKLADEIKNAISKLNPESIMVIGTSEKMVMRILDNLDLPQISEKIYIEDVASKEEIQRAKYMRETLGKHVIPVPTFEIREDFSGYFLHPMKFINKTFAKNNINIEKTIVRPTFSYLGNYTISDNVLINLFKFELNKFDKVCKICSINLIKKENGIVIDASVMLKYGVCINKYIHDIRNRVGNYIEHYTSVNVISVNIYIKGLKISDN